VRQIGVPRLLVDRRVAQALKTLVNLFLASKQPMFLGCWGADGPGTVAAELPR
jgi:hypothetical protein